MAGSRPRTLKLLHSGSRPNWAHGVITFVLIIDQVYYITSRSVGVWIVINEFHGDRTVRRFKKKKFLLISANTDGPIRPRNKSTEV